MDLQALAPVGEVGLARVAPGGVVREARGGHHGGAGAQQLEGRLVADLDPRPGDEGHAAVEVGRLEALLVVELGARGAQRVVEGVQRLVLDLADVAGLRLQHLARALHLAACPAFSRRGGGTKTSDSRAARIPVPARRERSCASARRRWAERSDLTRRRFWSRSGWIGAPGGHQEPRRFPRPAAARAASGRPPPPRAPRGRGAAPPARARRRPGSAGRIGSRARERGILGLRPSPQFTRVLSAGETGEARACAMASPLARC